MTQINNSFEDVEDPSILDESEYRINQMQFKDKILYLGLQST